MTKFRIDQVSKDENLEGNHSIVVPRWFFQKTKYHYSVGEYIIIKFEKCSAKLLLHLSISIKSTEHSENFLCSPSVFNAFLSIAAQFGEEYFFIDKKTPDPGIISGESLFICLSFGKTGPENAQNIISDFKRTIKELTQGIPVQLQEGITCVLLSIFQELSNSFNIGLLGPQTPVLSYKKSERTWEEAWQTFREKLIHSRELAKILYNKQTEYNNNGYQLRNILFKQNEIIKNRDAEKKKITAIETAINKTMELDDRLKKMIPLKAVVQNLVTLPEKGPKDGDDQNQIPLSEESRAIMNELDSLQPDIIYYKIESDLITVKSAWQPDSHRTEKLDESMNTVIKDIGEFTSLLEKISEENDKLEEILQDLQAAITNFEVVIEKSENFTFALRATLSEKLDNVYSEFKNLFSDNSGVKDTIHSLFINKLFHSFKAADYKILASLINELNRQIDAMYAVASEKNIYHSGGKGM